MVKINQESLFYTLSLRYNPTKNGIIQGTKNYPNLKALSYRNFTQRNFDYKSCVEKTESILNQNISKVKDKNVAIGLSGGTDSSLNALILSKNNRTNLKLFCIGFGDEKDEFNDARLVAKLTNRDYREFIIKDIVKDFPDRVWEFGSPKSNLWIYYNFKIVKKLGAKTTLSGEGGDELFGGYYFRYKNYLKKNPKSAFERAKWYIFGRSRDWIPNYHNMFGSKFKESLKIYDKKIINLFVDNFKNDLPFISQIFLSDYNHKLRFDFELTDNIFATKEKIRVVSPFLNSNLINFATHIPTSFKISENSSKMILREILKKNGMPRKIYEKPKQGWGMNPITIWKQGLDDKCEKFLFDGNVVRDGWIDKKFIKEIFSIIEQNKNSNPEKTYPFINKIWDLLSFEIFYLQRILFESKKGKITGW